MESKNSEDVKNTPSLRLKLIILFTDYLILICIVSVLNLVLSIKMGFYYTFLYWLLIYMAYYIFQEYFFKKTLGMRLFKVSLKTKDKRDFKNRFLLYAVLVFFDRVVLLIYYLFSVLLLSERKLLISEKYSGIRWERE